MKPLPSLQQLRAFEAVATLESISAAAQAIHVSQPSVTQAIVSLERKVGARLFARRRNGSYLTATGAIFLPRVARMMNQVRRGLCEPIVGQPFADAGSVKPLERKITDAQVRGLIAISQSASFDEAARRIGISEPSLHRSARTLERILRRTLYRRTAQGYTTTPAGAELARQFMLAAREIEYGMDEIRAERGQFVSRVVLGNIPHSHIHILSVAINGLLAKFPDASVEVLDGHYEDLLAALRNGRVDLVYGVLRRPEWVADIEERFLFFNRYAVVARQDHPIRTRAKITIAELARYDWIMPPSGTPRRQAFELIFQDHPSPPKVSIETTSMGMYRAVLSTSDMLSLFSRRDAMEDASFAPLRYDSPRLQRSDGIATRKDWKPTRIHLEFIERMAALANSAEASRAS
jgi:DNA-binding transcriptional LysR family regulator